MALWVWRSSDGLNGNGGLATAALDSLVSNNEPTLIVFMDAHQEWKDEAWVRKISDEQQILVQKGHAVVLLSPIYTIPIGVGEVGYTT